MDVSVLETITQKTHLKKYMGISAPLSLPGSAYDTDIQKLLSNSIRIRIRIYEALCQYFEDSNLEKVAQSFI